MPIEIRQATEADRPRMIEISSQIWDGEDYVPHVIDAWLTDPAGHLAVAALDGYIIGFGRRTWLSPGYAWFEGARTDPRYQGQGAGKALTRAFIAAATQEGARAIGLGTYVDNEASIHIIESFGFARVATFVYVEKEVAVTCASSSPDPFVVPIPLDEALSFVESSEFLALGHRRLAHGWRFIPYDPDPRDALGAGSIRWGVRREGNLDAVLCFRESETGSAAIVFADGDTEALQRLLREAHRHIAGGRLEVMVPQDGDRAAVLLDVVKSLDYKTWDGYAAAVFVYELRPERISDDG